MVQTSDADARELSAEELAAIEEKYDEGAQIRQVSGGATGFLRVIALTCSRALSWLGMARYSITRH